MFKRVDSLNYATDERDSPALSQELAREGHAIMRGAVSASRIRAIREQLLKHYAYSEPEMRASAINRTVGSMFRYGVFQDCPLIQEAISDARILQVLEPLLGSDCHVIACTSWKNPPGLSPTPHGLEWHIDGGPQVPIQKGRIWPSDITFPIFVVSTHLYLSDVGPSDGPTACIPGSHKSGMPPPWEHRKDDDLSFNGRSAVRHVVRAGDIDFRVSDVWHRRWPPDRTSRERLFVQTTYARRDIAQRIFQSSKVNHATDRALARCRSDRERRLLGQHPDGYFDA